MATGNGELLRPGPARTRTPAPRWPSLLALFRHGPAERRIDSSATPRDLNQRGFGAFGKDDVRFPLGPGRHREVVA